MSTDKIQKLPRLWPFKKTFYGWGIVAASVLVSAAQVPMYGPVLSVFVVPLNEDMGWTFTEISIAFTAGSLFGSFVSAIVGRQLDRYGARASVVVAGMIMTGCLIGLALMQEVWQFWGFFGLGRTAALAGINLGTSVAVGNWFIKKRGRAVSFLGIGLRAGQALYPMIIITPIIVAYSWRHAYAFLALTTIALIVIPGWIFLRRRPEDFGLNPDGQEDSTSLEKINDQSVIQETEHSFTLLEARRTAAFWLITVATMTVIFAQTAVNLHAVSSVIDRGGIESSFAGVFVFIIMGTAAASAYGWGALMDKIHVRWATIIATLFTAASMIVITFATSIWLAVAFAILFGLGTGGWTIAQTLLFANYFGRRHLGAIRGLSQVMSGPVGAAGPLMAGIIRDQTDSYTLSFAIFLLALMVVLLALLLARPPQKA
jgi:MFS family permease